MQKSQRVNENQSKLEVSNLEPAEHLKHRKDTKCHSVSKKFTHRETIARLSRHCGQ